MNAIPFRIAASLVVLGVTLAGWLTGQTWLYLVAVLVAVVAIAFIPARR